MTDNKQEYIEFAENTEDIPLFHQPWWLDTIVGRANWNVVLSKSSSHFVEAYWPFVHRRKFGISTIINPVLTPYLGPIIRYEKELQKRVSRYAYEHKIFNKIVLKLPHTNMQNVRCHPDLDNTMPAIINGYWHHSKYTYRILDKNLDRVYDRLKANVRTYIKKARDIYSIDMKIDAELLYELNLKTFARKTKDIPYSRGLVQKIIRNGLQHNCVKQYTIYKDQQAICSTLVLNDISTSYCLIVGLDKSLKPQGAIQWMIWEAINDTLSEGRVFDFEGTMIPEVEPVFRSFGGELSSYAVLTKANKYLSAAFQLVKGHPF